MDVLAVGVVREMRTTGAMTSSANHISTMGNLL